MNRARPVVDQPDLVVAALAAVLGGLAAIGPLDGFPLLRALLTIPLVLFLPGYALVTALFPSMVVPTVERILMAIGGSIVLAIVVGLVLGALPLHLSTGSWAAVLLTLTLALIVVAWARRTRSGIVGARPHIARMPLRAAILLGISVLIVADVVLGARLAATEAQGPVPAQLWLIPVSGAHEQARLGMRAGPDGGVYRVVLSSGGVTIHEETLDLTPGQTWETIVVFPEEIRAQPIVARLYEGTSAQESRFVTLEPVTDAATPAASNGSSTSPSSGASPASAPPASFGSSVRPS